MSEYSSPPSSVGAMCQDPQWIPETMGIPNSVWVWIWVCLEGLWVKGLVLADGLLTCGWVMRAPASSMDWSIVNSFWMGPGWRSGSWGCEFEKDILPQISLSLSLSLLSAPPRPVHHEISSSVLPHAFLPDVPPHHIGLRSNTVKCSWTETSKTMSQNKSFLLSLVFSGICLMKTD
jgi:hypothetical protein